VFGNPSGEVEGNMRFGSWAPFRTRNLWHGVDYLELIPVRRFESQEDPIREQIVVLMPRYRDFLFGRLVQPHLGPGKRFLRIPLEDRGSFLWRLCDGQRTVADLTAAFTDQFPADTDDAPRRVSIYLHAMYDNGFITYLNLAE
jgi:hypothetical protein